MMPGPLQPSILLLMGVAGSGKTTTGQKLAKHLGWQFRDADTFHPPANIEKMRSGEPLTDADREPWLDAIACYLDAVEAAGEAAVVTCSGLKRAYRQRLLDRRETARLVYLKGDKKLIADRMARRRGHFMPTSLLDNQFATLEEPRGAERPIVVNVAMSPNRVLARIVLAAGLDTHATPAGAPRLPQRIVD